MRSFGIHIALAMLMVYFVALYFQIHVTALIGFAMFVGAYFILWLLSWFYDRWHFRKLPLLLDLTQFFFREWFRSIIKVATEIVTPKSHINPAVVALPMDAKTDFEITCLANIITFTPSTLSIDFSEDRRTLYLHTFYVPDDDREAFKRSIKEGFERKILAITR